MNDHAKLSVGLPELLSLWVGDLVQSRAQGLPLACSGLSEAFLQLHEELGGQGLLRA
jgi:hypothetical protein